MIEKILERLHEEAMASSSALTEAIIGMQGASADFYSAEKSAYEKTIEIVQEVAKEYDWIPVEQKLPEDFTHVYATCISLIDDREPWVTEGVYHSVIGFGGMAPMLSMKNAVVIAWMPKKIPAPYQKGEQHERKQM